MNPKTTTQNNETNFKKQNEILKRKKSLINHKHCFEITLYVSQHILCTRRLPTEATQITFQ